MAGLVERAAFGVAFAQTNMADACRLAVVHVKGAIQEPRHPGAITWEGKTVSS